MKEEDRNEWKRNELPKFLLNYETKNVFNLDETGLFFKCLPNKTISVLAENIARSALLVWLVQTWMDGEAKIIDYWEKCQSKKH